MTTAETTDCLFCKIVAGEIPGDVVLATDEVVAFRDINPVGPTHVLGVPRDDVRRKGAGQLFGLVVESAAVESLALSGGVAAPVNYGASAEQGFAALDLCRPKVLVCGGPRAELARRHGGTMRVYWAGAAYRLEADLALRREHNSGQAVRSRS